MLNYLTIVLLLLAFTEISLQQGRRGPQSGSVSSSSSSSSSSSDTSSGRRGASTAAPKFKPSDPDEDEDSEDGPEFVCPKGDGLFADPNSCKRFYLCGAWHPYSQACPPSLYFDDKLKFCTFKTSSLVCGPTEEEKSNENGVNQEKLGHCDKQKCQLPSCFCSDEGTAIPGDLPPSQTPQFILLGFSGAINELVFEQYKKILGYNSKYHTQQTKFNPNGCGIRGTFFVNHEYANYAEIQWLATMGHEIGLHSITHRLPELWWTDTANYSQWAEEIIGLREIVLKFANGGTNNAILNRENVVGMRAPYVKPGGDAMFEVAIDFGLLYDSSIVAPRGAIPIWPFTYDYRQPFDCSNYGNKAKGEEVAAEEEEENFERRNGRSEPLGFLRQKRSTKYEKYSKWIRKKATAELKNKPSLNKSRSKRNSPYLGRPLRCPTKPYPGLWEIPVNPLYNEYNTCPHVDQCVFPSSDETDDASDIVDFLKENFNHHYTTNRAPFLLNFHITWFTSKTKVKALNKFIDYILKENKETYFITYHQLVDWMKNPQPLNSLNIKCENKTGITTCNRPHTCVIKHHVDNENIAATEEAATRTDTRYMPVCHPTACPSQYPWYGNHAGAFRNFKTIMQLVDDALITDEKES